MTTKPRKPTARALQQAVADAVTEPAAEAEFVPTIPAADEVEAIRASLMVAIGNVDDDLFLVDNDITAEVDRRQRRIGAAGRRHDREVVHARLAFVEATKPLDARRSRLMVVKAAHEVSLASLPPSSTEASAS